MTKKTLLTVFSLLIFCTGCAPHSEPPMTQLEVRIIQTREFDTMDNKLVMKTMMNVLQDEGYIIKNAVLDLGLLTAEKQVDIENKALAVLCAVGSAGGGTQARWPKHKVIEASANVSEFGSQTRVRINFQYKTFDNYGCVNEVIAVKDQEIYQEFFSKVHKGIFLEKEGI